MDVLLSPEEVRVLGCLLEKQITTPDYYPLTLNALTAACNQKTSRDPVVDYDDKTVLRALDQLREKKLSLMHYVAGGRVPKYEHRVDEHFDFTEEQRGVLCLLLLRGPQTAGELKSRSGRLCSFSSPTEVERVLGSLVGHENGPFVAELPRLPGAREPRFMHLLSGQPELPDPASVPVPKEAARQALEQEQLRWAEMEATIAELKAELTELRAQFQTFRDQFE
jgi:uncharacterized protein YceH (UPF0502 family)